MGSLKEVKITVVQRDCNKELIEEYAASGIGACGKVELGDVFISKDGKMPEGFCVEAWSSFDKYVFALAHGADGFWESWIPKRGVSINSCNDGLRPVIFKLETDFGE